MHDRKFHNFYEVFVLYKSMQSLKVKNGLPLSLKILWFDLL